MKFKATAALLIFSLVLLGALPSSLAGKFTGKASAQTNGPHYQIKDIGPKLRKQAEDEDYQRKLKKKLIQRAEELNLDEKTKNNDSSANDSDPTNDNPTKVFMSFDNKGALGGYHYEMYTRKGVGENVEVWVAQDLSWLEGQDRKELNITQQQIHQLIEEFDSNIYPKETEFFGQPDKHNGDNALLSQAGVVPKGYYAPEDGKAKVMLLIDNFQDVSYYNEDYPFYVAGFYSGTYEIYFDRNIVNIDAANIVGSGGSYGTLAHEFQHLIHDDNDSDEVTWLNEGMSDLAEFIVGYGQPTGHIQFYLNHPENSLVSWDEYLDAPTGPETLGDYGQAYLLELYLLEHYGEDFIQKLAHNPANGIQSVDKVLNDVKAGIDFTELFRNFSVALAIDSPKPGHGKYNFKTLDIGVNYKGAVKFNKEGVPAWGTDYIKLPDNPKNVAFDLVDFIPIQWKSVEDPLNDGHGKVLYSGKGNLADKELIIKADLTGTSAPSLEFDHYYNIEETWDYGMVQVSTDGGHTWTSLSNENTRSDLNPGAHPKIKNNVPGFTGTNGDWEHESFDLSKYAGQKVLVSFRYLTDWASNEDGWYIDNITISGTDFSSDGSSLNDFHSIGEILGHYVNYQVTLINKKVVANGKRTQYKVLTYDPFNVTDETLKSLKKIRSKGENYMVFTHPAREGNKSPVNYDYEALMHAWKHGNKHKSK